jgi:lysophospholipase L1-like esterase
MLLMMGDKFTPRSLPNLDLWLSLDGVGLADGDMISSFPDISGNGRHAVQATDDLKPLFKTNILGGRPVARFDGTNDIMLTSSFLGAGHNTAFTIYWVAPSRQVHLKVLASNAGSKLYIGEASGQIGDVIVNTSGLSTTQKATSFPIGLSRLTDPYWSKPQNVYGFSYNGSTVIRSVNGLTTSYAATGNLGMSGELTLGNLSTGGGYFWNGDLSEMIIYNQAHTASQIRQVSAYLGGKFGIAQNFSHWCFVGDSRTDGIGSASGKGYVGLLKDQCANPATLIYNHGASSTTVANWIANTPIDQLAAFLNESHSDICVVWGGVNDFALNGSDAAAIYALLETLCTAKKALGYNKVYVCTEIDAQYTTPAYDAWHATVYPALNVLLRADYSWCDGLIDLGADARLQDATNTTYFNDKLHLKDAGYAVVAGLVKAKIDAG